MDIDLLKLGGSTNGRNILVAATATTGTLLHTAVNVSGQYDVVHIYAINTHTANVDLTIEAGGTTNPNDLILLAIPYKSGLIYVLPGLPYDGGVIIRAFASVANKINISGVVYRYKP
jgi:hypothetical protein